MSNTIPNQDGFQNVQISLGNLGHLDLAIEPSSLEGLASVILTRDPMELDDVSTRDILMEIINIVAGRFCHDLIQENQEFQLGLPELGLANKDSLGEPVICAFTMDGNPALQFRYFPIVRSA